MPRYIDTDLLNKRYIVYKEFSDKGLSYIDIARYYGCTKVSIFRYCSKHFPLLKEKLSENARNKRSISETTYVKRIKTSVLYKSKEIRLADAYKYVGMSKCGYLNWLARETKLDDIYTIYNDII